IMQRIEKSISELDQRQIKMIKILLNKWGEIKIKISDLPESVNKVSVIISQSKIISTDRFRHFKTTNRKIYDEEYSVYKSKGLYEVLYLNEKNELAEGSRSNIFLKKDNLWFTPTLNSGALPGIYRKFFIKNNINISEKNIKIEDLLNADRLLLTNALRGEINVNKVFINNEEFIDYQE
ncbi:MAG: aminotransferase class IV, partial [Ignavibacteriaceae bacterium]